MGERRSTRIHDSYAYTVEKLRKDVPRCWMDPDKARARLVELRDLFDTLLTTKSDAVRARVVNKLRRRLVLGYSNMGERRSLERDRDPDARGTTSGRDQAPGGDRTVAEPSRCIG